MSTINIKTKEEYNSVVLNGKVIIKVSTQTCAPCKMMAPLFEKLSEEFEDILFYNLSPDSSEELSVLAKNDLNIVSVPTFLVYEDGALTTKVAGAHPLSTLKNKLGL